MELSKYKDYTTIFVNDSQQENSKLVIADIQKYVLDKAALNEGWKVVVFAWSIAFYEDGLGALAHKVSHGGGDTVNNEVLIIPCGVLEAKGMDALYDYGNCLLVIDCSLPVKVWNSVMPITVCSRTKRMSIVISTNDLDVIPFKVKQNADFITLMQVTEINRRGIKKFLDDRVLMWDLIRFISVGCDELMTIHLSDDRLECDEKAFVSAAQCMVSLMFKGDATMEGMKKVDATLHVLMKMYKPECYVLSHC